MDIQIVHFQSAFAKDFKKLNADWISKYFILEPGDAFLLDHPEESIIKKGGIIRFAKYDNEIVGTGALLKYDQEKKYFHITKMAVAEAYQGRGIGKLILKTLIDDARSQNAIQVSLYTNGKLQRAVELYTGFGFSIVSFNDIDKRNINKRSQIKMVLDLSTIETKK